MAASNYPEDGTKYSTKGETTIMFTTTETFPQELGELFGVEGAENPFKDDWKNDLKNIREGRRTYGGSGLSSTGQAALYEGDLRLLTLAYLAENAQRWHHEVAYVSKDYDALFKNGTILTIQAVFLSKKAQREGKVRVYEYILYKAGKNKWYCTGQKGHNSLLGTVRVLKESAREGEFYIRGIRVIPPQTDKLLDYFRKLPENPYKEDREMLDW